jgi:hypothetical protein
MAGTGSRAGPSSYHLLAVLKKVGFAKLVSDRKCCLIAEFHQQKESKHLLSLDF